MIGRPRLTPAAGPGADRTNTEERVSILTGDRLCTRCSYNLVGQTVVREPHYDLLIVRCPECGTVAGVQEYPLLGRWAPRLGVVLAALWFVLLLGAWGASTAAICGFSVGTAESAARDYGSYLRDAYRASKTPALVTSAGPTGVTGAGVPVPTPGLSRGADYLAWWQAQDHDALLAGAGGWLGAVNWSALIVCVPGTILFFAIGCFWTIALLAVRRRWVLAWGFFVLGIASILAVTATWEWSDAPARRFVHAGRAEIGAPMLLILLTAIAVPLSAGILLGRPLLRGMVRALLPPRLRGPLAGLWLTQGLTPPGHPDAR